MNDPGCLAAMNFLAAYGKTLNPSARSYKENSILEAQEKEEIYLHFNWPFVVPLLQEKQLLPEPNVVAPLPAGPEGKATVLGGGYLAISAVAPHPQEAARLIAFLTGSEAQRFFVKNLGWMPIRSEAWDVLPEKMREEYHGFIEMAPYVRPRPPVQYYESLSRLWQQAFRDIVFESKPVKETMDHYAAEAATLRESSTSDVSGRSENAR
jgi:ABC-type glycerol-3-phosphate transport system substrate-binding protein